jgi:tetratricopeptide (TPR) repeat protein
MDEEEERRIAEHLEQRAKSTAKAFYRQGLASQNEGNYEEAMKRFDLALIWDPSYDAALKSLESLGQKMKEQECNQLVSEGIADFNQGNYIDAVLAFGRVLETDPHHEVARGWLETASDALVEIQVARMRLKKEVEDEIATYITEGLAEYSRKDYRRAIDRWSKVIALDPSHAEAREWIEKAEAAISLEIREALAAVDRAMTAGRWREAQRNVIRVLSLDPRNQSALAKRDEMAKRLRDLSEGHARKGVEFYRQKEFGLAVAEFTMALDLNEKNTTAIEYLERSRSMERQAPGESASDLYMKGVDAYTREDYRVALVYWKRVLELDPGHLNAKRNIKRAEEKLKISGQ